LESYSTGEEIGREENDYREEQSELEPYAHLWNVFGELPPADLAVDDEKATGYRRSIEWDVGSLTSSFR
jgi:hypothetical protein